MEYTKKKYIRPLFDVVAMTFEHHLCDPSEGESDVPLSKENSITFDDGDITDLWGDNDEEE